MRACGAVERLFECCFGVGGLLFRGYSCEMRFFVVSLQSV